VSASAAPGPRLITTFGELSLPDTDVIVPHEHIFLDLRLPSHPQHGQALVEDVLELMQPELERARAAGVAVLVDATPVGMGRRADIVVAVSRAARLPVPVPTGMLAVKKGMTTRSPEWYPADAQRVGAQGEVAR
jgi:phosphotriesterase-related protein